MPLTRDQVAAHHPTLSPDQAAALNLIHREAREAPVLVAALRESQFVRLAVRDRVLKEMGRSGQGLSVEDAGFVILEFLRVTSMD